MPINVLLVDDSAIVRGLFANALTADPAIQICGSAGNGEVAISLARSTQPDIVILDIEMPVMDGITALPQILTVSPKSKVIIASTLTLRNAEISLKALSLGASDYLAKPSLRDKQDSQDFFAQLVSKIKALATDTVPHATNEPAKPQVYNQIPLHVMGVKALAIASSTGGPQALLDLFAQIKGRLKNIPIFITQHMPPTFTTILAEHISKAGDRSCIEVKGGEVVQGGAAYLAQGDYHMIPEKHANGEVLIRITQDAQENFCRPAADPMFRALSAIYGRQLLAMVLTGIGQDGMQGAKAIVAQGGHVIAQDKESSVVYGMPKAVAEQKLCRAILPLSQMGGYLLEQIEGRS
ncbi:MAG: chemotaxis response regulator protein-glutamate methylesterase [Rickettsiales bacterium]|nr:chemotaxis response regulator protein-glutamate methylesterase [Rickettsiales bacterium]